MSLQHLRLSEVDEKVLAGLAANGACESRTLEFKEALQVTTDEQKIEFLSDVTALANSDGGDLVFGVRAEKGVAAEVVGLRNFVPDDRIGTLENLLRDSVQPRVSGLQIEARKLENGNHALLVRVGRSYAAPHMVRHKGVTRFCGRNATGKYDLDVQELRSAFLGSEGMADRLKNFRLERINRLVSGRGPVKLISDHLMVVHLLPVVSARPDMRLGTSDLERLAESDLPKPPGIGGCVSSFNMEGLLVTPSWKMGAYGGYVQVFRSGFIEAVDCQTLDPNGLFGRAIPGTQWERCIVQAFPGYVRALQALNLRTPYVAGIGLLGVRGHTMAVEVGLRGGGGEVLDRDHLITDEILIEDVTKPPGSLLRPLFDQIWNGFGWSRSMNYNKEGEWGERR